MSKEKPKRIVKQSGKRTFHESALGDVRKGIVIPIPIKKMNSFKLSGVHRKPIKIHKTKLFKSKKDINIHLIMTL